MQIQGTSNKAKRSAAGLIASLLLVLGLFAPAASAAGDLTQVAEFKERGLDFFVEMRTGEPSGENPDGNVTVYSGFASKSGEGSFGAVTVDRFDCDEGEELVPPFLLDAPLPGVVACDYLGGDLGDLSVQKLTVNNKIKKGKLKATLLLQDGAELPLNLELAAEGLLQKNKIVDTLTIGENVDKQITVSKSRLATLSGTIGDVEVPADASSSFMGRSTTTIFSNFGEVSRTSAAPRIADLIEGASR